ncbi:MAG: hypothetical protein U5N86_04660 [Planctomycetota bacterium]|nr:hypothetical protein [Planctomycetota bacterium]
MKRYGFTLLTLVFLGVSLACGGGGGEGDGSTDAGLAAGFPHSLVLYSDGSVYAWGWNDEGQLGLGDDVERDTPTLVGALSDKGVISITAGSDHSLVLCSDGSVYAWGDNNSGQLGLGDELDRDFPTLVSTLSDKDVISLAGGFAHSLALCSDGSVYTWGKNDDGQLGLGDDVDRDIPTLVGALSDKDVISLTAGTDLLLCPLL